MQMQFLLIERLHEAIWVLKEAVSRSFELEDENLTFSEDKTEGDIFDDELIAALKLETFQSRHASKLNSSLCRFEV